MSLLSWYGRLPGAAQDLACTIEGWWIQRDRYPAEFHSLLKEAEQRATWPDAEVQRWRDASLQSFLIQACRESPFYQQRFQAAGIAAEDIGGLGGLGALPILTKADVLANHASIAVAFPPRQLRPQHTSGTTGAGLQFMATATAVREQWATWWRYRRWHGLELGTKCAYFGGRPVVKIAQNHPPFWRHNWSGRQILFSGYHLNRRNLPAYLGELRRGRPTWLHGYPSLLALLAAYVVDTGFDLGYKVRWITTGAENLLRPQIDVIQRAFGVRPRQHYGLTEAVANLSECELGTLHIDEDFAAVELLPEPGSELLKVVGVNFTNPAMPLIRYDAGDRVTPSAEGCPCGRPGRTVKEVDGRAEDYIVLDDGTRIGRLDHVFKDAVNVHEAQFHQRRTGEVTVRIAKGGRYTSADEERLLGALRQYLGNKARIQLDYVQNVERSSTGKLRFVISELPEAKIEEPCV